MAEPTQFGFDLKEAATALIKHQGLHEGVWIIGIEFGLAAGLFGPTAAEARPSALVQINKLQLVRHTDPNTEPPHFAVDAAEANPARAERKSRSRSV